MPISTGGVLAEGGLPHHYLTELIRLVAQFDPPASDEDYVVDLAFRSCEIVSEVEFLGARPGMVGRTQRRVIVWHGVPLGLLRLRRTGVAGGRPTRHRSSAPRMGTDEVQEVPGGATRQGGRDPPSALAGGLTPVLEVPIEGGFGCLRASWSGRPGPGMISGCR